MIIANLNKLIDDGLKEKFNISGRPTGYTIYCSNYIANLLRDSVGEMKIIGSDHHSLEGRILIHKHDDIIDGFNNPATYSNPMNLGPLSFGKR